jgi:hypothetical protein
MIAQFSIALKTRLGNQVATQFFVPLKMRQEKRVSARLFVPSKIGQENWVVTLFSFLAKEREGKLNDHLIVLPRQR